MSSEARQKARSLFLFAPSILWKLQKNHLVEIVPKETPPPLPWTEAGEEMETSPSILTADQEQGIAEITEALSAQKFHSSFCTELREAGRPRSISGPSRK
jgi:hypothetical protein